MAIPASDWLMAAITMSNLAERWERKKLCALVETERCVGLPGGLIDRSDTDVN